MKLVIIIPAYNEEGSIGAVIKSIPKKLKGITKIKILVVNDGSCDKTAQVAREAGARVLSHPINQGVGAATITGFQAAKLLKVDIALTLDADGQHDPGEIEKIIKPIIKKGYDVASGARLIGRNKNMPAFRLFGQFSMNLMTFWLYRIMVLDSQSGFRAFSIEALNKMNLTSSGYEICSEIIGEIKKNKLKYLEVPIKTIYTRYSKGKGQFWLNAVNIVVKLIVRAIAD